MCIAVFISLATGILAGRFIWKESVGKPTNGRANLEQRSSILGDNKEEETKVDSDGTAVVAVPTDLVEVQLPLDFSATDLLSLFHTGGRQRSIAKLQLAIGKLDGAGFRRLAKELSTGKFAYGNNDSWEVRHAVFTQWAERNPNEALEFAKTIKNVGMRSGIIGTIFSQLAHSDPQYGVKALKSLQPRGTQVQAMHAFSRELGKKDPRAAIRMLDEFGTSPDSWHYYEIARDWAWNDPGAASAFAGKLKPGPKKSMMLRNIASTWAASDPESALEWAKNREPQYQRIVLGAVIGAMAAENPQSALEQAETLPRQFQHEMKVQVAQNWMNSDPDSALAWIQSIPNESEKNRLFHRSAGNLVWQDPQRAIKVISEFKDSAQSMDLLGNALRYWSWNSPSDAMKWLKTLSPTKQGRILGEAGYIGGLAVGAGDDFKELLKGIAMTDQNKSAFREMAENYALSDPQKALEWAAGIESESARSEIIASTHRAWSWREPQAAAESALQLDNIDNRKRTLREVASNWARQDPDGVRAWAEQIPGEERTEMLGQVIKSQAGDNPEYAAKQLQDLIPNDPDNNTLMEAAGQVASSWANSDPAGAAAWALSLESEGARKKSIGQVTEQWSRYDPVAASEWVQSLDAGPARDEASAQLANNIYQTDPESAFLWATSIGDERQRFQTAERIVQGWRNSNPEAARGAVENADFSEADRGRLLEKLNRGSVVELENDPFE